MTPTPTTRVSLDLLAFQRLTRGEVLDTTGYNGSLDQEVPVEVSLAMQDIGWDNMIVAVQKPRIDTIERERLLDQDVLLPILDRMDTYGGSFVKQLSAMTRRGDAVNRVKCVLNWLQYFLEYKVNTPEDDGR